MFGLGLIELAFVAVFFILMVIGTALDRRYNESPKWWIFGLGIAAVVAYYWSAMDFSTLWGAVTQLQFWMPLGIYLVAGLAYSVLEFVLSVRKMARLHKDSWSSFMKRKEVVWKTAAGETVDSRYVSKENGKHYIGNVRDIDSRKEVTSSSFTYSDVMRAAQMDSATDDQKRAAESLLDIYLRTDEYRLSDLKKDFITVQLNSTYEVEPVINRVRLASFIGAWTFFWPAYAVSLIVGDFLVEVFRMLGDVFSKLGGRFVRFSFAGVFSTN